MSKINKKIPVLDYQLNNKFLYVYESLSYIKNYDVIKYILAMKKKIHKNDRFLLIISFINVFLMFIF
jgi:hypothetical protein